MFMCVAAYDSEVGCIMIRDSSIQWEVPSPPSAVQRNQLSVDKGFPSGKVLYCILEYHHNVIIQANKRLRKSKQLSSIYIEFKRFLSYRHVGISVTLLVTIKPSANKQTNKQTAREIIFHRMLYPANRMRNTIR